MLCIAANSVAMACTDYSGKNEQLNSRLDIAGLTFSVIFTIEALLKIIAMGFVMSKKSYLRSPWNILDFVIVLAGVVEVLFEYVFSFATALNLKSLRTLRVLRPLKGAKTIPSLRKQVSALLESVLGLVNVLVFLLFIFVLFGIMGLQWF